MVGIMRNIELINNNESIDCNKLNCNRNILLFVLDFTLFLPMTLTRLILIYFFGSRYNISGFEFLDVITHAENKYYNQANHNITIDTIDKDYRISINEGSKLTHLRENIPLIIKSPNVTKSSDSIELDEELYF